MLENMIVANLTHVLFILALATKAIKEQRTSKSSSANNECQSNNIEVAYFKLLFGKDSKIQAALRKLTQLSTQESLAMNVARFSALESHLRILEKYMQGQILFGHLDLC